MQNRDMKKPFLRLIRPGEWTVLAALAAILLMWQAPFFSFLHQKHFMPLYIHSLMELSSVIVAVALFAVVWGRHSKWESGNLIILSCMLLASGVIDIAHMLSYNGMPDFVTPSGREKGINFWLAARFIAAMAFLAIALRADKPFLYRHSHKLILFFAVLLVAVVYWAGLFHQELWPRTFIAGIGLTAFKQGAESFFIAIMSLSALLLYGKWMLEKSEQAYNLYIAASIIAVSEFCFIIYYDVTDIFNLFGHILKVAAFYFIMKEALRRSPEELSSFFNISPNMLCIADIKGGFRRINDSWEKKLGFLNEEIMEKNLFDFVYGEDIQPTQQAVKLLYEKKSITNFENRLVCKDGSYLWLSWSGASFGTLIYVVLHDITQLKNAQDRLKTFNEALTTKVEEEVEKRMLVESQRTADLEQSNIKLKISDRKFRQLFTEMLTGFALHEIVCDDEGKVVDYRFLEVNPAFENITGLKASEIVGKTVLEVMPQTERCWIERYGSVATTGRPIQFMDYAKELGKYFEVSAYSPTKNQFACVFSDVTERQLADEKLKAFNEELQAQVAQGIEKIHEEEKLLLKQSKIAVINEIISAIAHQWRQPLNIIGLGVQDIAYMYEIGGLNDEYMSRQQDTVMKHVMYLSQTINNFADFFRPQEKPELFLCRDAIKKVYDLIAHEYKSSGIDIVMDDTDASVECLVLGFENDLAHAILNMVSNSKDAIAQRRVTEEIEGSIHIGCIAEGDGRHCIKIQDNGGGIDPQVLENIFMPYFSTKSVAIGSGMGLYFSKMIIEESMSGKLEVKNEKDGALVTITLPCSHELESN